MASPDLTELKKRICEVVKEAVLSELTLTVAAVHYFTYTQNSGVYFTTRIAGDEIGFDSNEIDTDVYTVILRCVIGHVGEGYEGQTEEVLDDIIPVVKTAINQNEGLQSAAYPDEMAHLLTGADRRMRSHSGFRVFEDSGLLGTRQIGTEFVINCQFNLVLDPY